MAGTALLLHILGAWAGSLEAPSLSKEQRQKSTNRQSVIENTLESSIRNQRKSESSTKPGFVNQMNNNIVSFLRPVNNSKMNIKTWTPKEEFK